MLIQLETKVNLRSKVKPVVISVYVPICLYRYMYIYIDLHNNITLIHNNINTYSSVKVSILIYSPLKLKGVAKFLDRTDHACMK
jgi:hypothetical protein